MGVRCFLLEETGMVQRSLRRYEMGSEHDRCPVYGYHTAKVPLDTQPAIYSVDPDGRRLLMNGDDGSVSHDDPRWPRACACGYVFNDEHTAYQIFAEALYRRADTGEEMTIRDAPPGAMWWVDWMSQRWRRLFCVRLPDGSDWMPDMQASNCALPDDTDQARHHCWVIRGTTLPHITVDKQSVTCAAGAGSIQSPLGRYHGFLTAGELT